MQSEAAGLAAAAWLIAGVCVAISAWATRRLARLVPPAPADIDPRPRGLASAAEKVAAREAFGQERAEAERALLLAELWPRSLARIALASGTALAVTSLAKGLGAGGGALPGGILEFVAGFTGMAVCATFGRQAKDRASDLRRRWRHAAKAAARE
jgi:hypothetical protein